MTAPSLGRHLHVGLAEIILYELVGGVSFMGSLPLRVPRKFPVTPRHSLMVDAMAVMSAGSDGCWPVDGETVTCSCSIVSISRVS